MQKSNHYIYQIQKNFNTLTLENDDVKNSNRHF